MIGLSLLFAAATLASDRPAPPLPTIVTHDNRQPAGTLRNGVLTLELKVQTGLWHPEGGDKRAIRIEAFGEASSSLSAPAPLIRVPEGTRISATVRNELELGLRLSGLCDRGEPACPPIDVAAGQSRHIEFMSGPAGTYHYWAT